MVGRTARDRTAGTSSRPPVSAGANAGTGPPAQRRRPLGLAAWPSAGRHTGTSWKTRPHEDFRICRRAEVVGFSASIDGSLLCSDLPAQDGGRDVGHSRNALRAITNGALSIRKAQSTGSMLNVLKSSTRTFSEPPFAI